MACSSCSISSNKTWVYVKSGQMTRREHAHQASAWVEPEEASQKAVRQQAKAGSPCLLSLGLPRGGGREKMQGRDKDGAVHTIYRAPCARRGKKLFVEIPLRSHFSFESTSLAVVPLSNG
jgi:hypothetical protein